MKNREAEGFTVSTSLGQNAQRRNGGDHLARGDSMVLSIGRDSKVSSFCSIPMDGRVVKGGRDMGFGMAASGVGGWGCGMGRGYGRLTKLPPSF